MPFGTAPYLSSDTALHVFKYDMWTTSVELKYLTYFAENMGPVAQSV